MLNIKGYMNNFLSGTAIFINAGVGIAETSGLNLLVAASGLLVVFIANSHKMYTGARDFIREVRKDRKEIRNRRKNQTQKGE